MPGRILKGGHSFERVIAFLNFSKYNRAFPLGKVLTNEIEKYYQEDFMGKGDKRTRRGKIYRGTHGKLRPSNLKKKKS